MVSLALLQIHKKRLCRRRTSNCLCRVALLMRTWTFSQSNGRMDLNVFTHASPSNERWTQIPQDSNTNLNILTLGRDEKKIRQMGTKGGRLEREGGGGGGGGREGQKNERPPLLPPNPPPPPQTPTPKKQQTLVPPKI